MTKKLYSFRETKAFTKNVSALFSEENYFAFQDYLQENHNLGDVIPGGGGLRKIRWLTTGKGKRGGARVIYYFASEIRLYLFVGNLRKKQENGFGKRSVKKIGKTSSGVVEMNEKDFDELLESIKEVGLMEKGEIGASREFVVKNEFPKNASNVKSFAICLTIEDEELIPMKIYSVILHPHLKTCTVKDETGETLACPIEWFLPIKFPENISKTLEKTELALA